MSDSLAKIFWIRPCILVVLLGVQGARGYLLTDSISTLFLCHYISPPYTLARTDKPLAKINLGEIVNERKSDAQALKKIRELLELNREKFLSDAKGEWSQANLKKTNWQNYWKKLILTMGQPGQESVITLQALMIRVDQRWGGILFGTNGVLLLLDKVQLLKLDEQRKLEYIQKSERMSIDLDEIFKGDGDQVRSNLINLLNANREQFLINSVKGWTEENLWSWGHEWPNIQLKTQQGDQEKQIQLLPLLIRANQRWGGIRKGTNGVKIFLHKSGLLKLTQERLAALAGEGKLPRIHLEEIVKGDDDKVKKNLRELFQVNRALFLNDPEKGWEQGNLKKATWGYWERMKLKTVQEGQERGIQLPAIMDRVRRKGWVNIREGTHGMKELLSQLGLIVDQENKIGRLLLTPL